MIIGGMAVIVRPKCPRASMKPFADSWLPQRPSAKCDGQALTEFLVLAVALIPIYLLIPMIAKYQDISHAVQLASRYVAFEATIRNDTLNAWKTEGQLAGEVRRRFFGNSDAPIKTNDIAGNFLADQNLFWRGPDGAPLIKNFDTDVSVSFGPGGGPAHSDAFTPASDGAPFHSIIAALGVDTANELNLKSRGIYTSNVTVKLANLPAGLKHYQPFDTIDLAMTRHTSILIDGWQAKDPNDVQSRIATAKLVPGTTLAATAPVVNASISIVEVGQMSGPRLGKLDFWNDVVPADRLK